MYARLIDAMNARFAARFVPDGEDYLYRTNPGVPPTRITARGYHLLIDGFSDRSNWWLTGTVAANGVLLLFVYIALAAPGPQPSQDLINFGMVPVFVVLAVLGGWFDLWEYPRRSLYRGLIERKQIRKIWPLMSEYDSPWLMLLLATFVFTNTLLREAGRQTVGFWTIVGLACLLLVVYVAIKKFLLASKPLLPNLNQPDTRHLPR